MRLKLNYGRFNLVDFTFMAGYFCILLAFLFTCTTYPNNYEFINTMTRNLRVVGYAFLMVKLLSNLALKRDRVALLVLVIIAIFITVYITDSIVLLTDILVIISSVNIELKKVIKFDLVCRLFFLVFALLSYYLGIIPEVVDYRNWVEIRHSWGFAHPNRLALHLLVMCLYLFYLSYNKKRSFYRFAFYAIAFYFNYSVTGGRTSAVGILFLFILELYRKSRYASLLTEFLNKGKNVVSNILLFGSVFISFLIAMLSAIGVIQYNGTTISSRAVLAGRALITYGLTIFGRKIETVGTLEAQRQGIASNGVDNAFVYLLVNYGLIVFVIFVLLLYATFKEINKRSDYAAFICMTIIIVSSIMEGQFINVESNLFLLLSAYLFSLNKNKLIT